MEGAGREDRVPCQFRRPAPAPEQPGERARRPGAADARTDQSRGRRRDEGKRGAARACGGAAGLDREQHASARAPARTRCGRVATARAARPAAAGSSRATHGRIAVQPPLGARDFRHPTADLRPAGSYVRQGCGNTLRLAAGERTGETAAALAGAHTRPHTGAPRAIKSADAQSEIARGCRGRPRSTDRRRGPGVSGWQAQHAGQARSGRPPQKPGHVLRAVTRLGRGGRKQARSPTLPPCLQTGSSRRKTSRARRNRVARAGTRRRGSRERGRGPGRGRRDAPRSRNRRRQWVSPAQPGRWKPRAPANTRSRAGKTNGPGRRVTWLTSAPRQSSSTPPPRSQSLASAKVETDPRADGDDGAPPGGAAASGGGAGRQGGAGWRISRRESRGDGQGHGRSRPLGTPKEQQAGPGPSVAGPLASTGHEGGMPPAAGKLGEGPGHDPGGLRDPGALSPQPQGGHRGAERRAADPREAGGWERQTCWARRSRPALWRRDRPGRVEPGRPRGSNAARALDAPRSHPSLSRPGRNDPPRTAGRNTEARGGRDGPRSGYDCRAPGPGGRDKITARHRRELKLRVAARGAGPAAGQDRREDDHAGASAIAVRGRKVRGGGPVQTRARHAASRGTHMETRRDGGEPGQTTPGRAPHVGLACPRHRGGDAGRRLARGP
ncbi:unnamed protein product [Dicrocoelium dendriticum]|nr:unnamed protein product [Dicrocoelium dendriticum]